MDARSRDNDGDKVGDDEDECPDLPEEEGGNGDGCPDHAKVTIKDGKVTVIGRVLFHTGSAKIRQSSEPIVHDVAVALKEHPEVDHIIIEGHTDSQGGDDVNLRLSTARAESVKKALVARGVEGSRLETRGYGETSRWPPTRPGQDAPRTGAWSSLPMRCTMKTSLAFPLGPDRERADVPARLRLVPLPCRGAVMTDPFADVATALAERDIVGNPADAAGLRASDSQFFYLRLRMEEDPAPGGTLQPFAWGIEIDTNGNLNTYEVLLTVR